MVLARIFAEVTVLLILVVLPAVLAVSGHLQSAAITAKVVVFALSAISALILPAYAFITWSVVVDQNGLTAMSLAKHQRCEFKDMKRMSRRSNWNWVRYVIEHQHGELSFPIWLVNCDELLDAIKKRLPSGSRMSSPFRKFSQDKISLLFQCVQAVLGIGLVAVFWFFYYELANGKGSNQTDLMIVLAFCLILTVIFIWRSTVIFLIPKSVELTPSGIIIDTMAFTSRITWQNVLHLKPAMPLLPEGFMLSTSKGSFLIGNGMDSADELVSSIKSKLPPDAAGEKTQSETGSLIRTGSNAPGTLDFSPGGDTSIVHSDANSNNEPISETQVAITRVPSTEQDNIHDSRSQTGQQKLINNDSSSSSSSDSSTNSFSGLKQTADDNAPKDATKQSSGKKADRKFRKRKNKKNPPK